MAEVHEGHPGILDLLHLCVQYITSCCGTAEEILHADNLSTLY